METFEFQAQDAETGLRLDLFLAGAAPELSRSRIKDLIERGLVFVDGECAKAARKLKAGQTIVMRVPAPAPIDVRPDETVEFSVLYQDQDIIVVNKPPGLVVHPAAGHRTGTLVHGLLAVCPDLTGVGGELRPGIVHRLDKDTSGVMVAAKNDAAHRALVEAFKEGRINKSYLALCLGGPPRDEDLIDAPIGRHPVRRKEMAVRPQGGRSALSRYRVLKRYPQKIGFLEVKIMTGRTHQIRVHLASIGCPVLGDAVYGAGTGALKAGGGPLKGLVRRQMLHSSRLGLIHPTMDREMEFTAPLAPDMKKVIEILEKKC